MQKKLKKEAQIEESVMKELEERRRTWDVNNGQFDRFRQWYIGYRKDIWHKYILTYFPRHILRLLSRVACTSTSLYFLHNFFSEDFCAATLSVNSANESNISGKIIYPGCFTRTRFLVYG